MASCSKEEPPTVTYVEEVRLYVNAKINGQPVEFNAGQNNYYLETSYSFKDSVVTMEGLLAPLGINPVNGFAIKLRSKRKFASDLNFDVDHGFASGIMPIREQGDFKTIPGEYEINFSSTHSTIPSVAWSFPDGSSADANQVRKVVDIKDYLVYPTTLLAHFSPGCNSRVTHNVNVVDQCDATFNITWPQTLVGSASLNIRSGQQVDEVSWVLNGTRVASGPSPTIAFLYGGTHTLKAEVTFVNGCTKVVEREVKTGSPYCEADFTYSSQKHRVYDPAMLGTVELIYYDENGKAYSSNYSEPSGDFEISSLKAYESNEFGQPTMRFIFEAEGVLKSSDGSSVQVSEGFGNFAVAHP